MALMLRGNTWYAHFSYREKQPNGVSKVKKEWISLECTKKEIKLRDKRYGRLLELREGQGKKDGNVDFDIFRLTTLARIKQTQEKPTYYHARRAFTMLAQFRLIKKLRDLTPAVLQNFQDWNKIQGKSNVHNNRLVRDIKKFMYRAELDELIYQQPWKKVHALPEPTNTVKPFTRTEIKKMLALDSQPEHITVPVVLWHAFVAFGVFLGPRRGEISNYLKTDVSLERNIISVHRHKKDLEQGILQDFEPKDYEERDTPIHPELLPYIKFLLSNEPECPYLFCYKKKPISKDYWTDKFKIFALAAGVKNATPHRLRHTFGTLVGEKSGAGAIKTLMGHKSLKTSQRYVHSGDIVAAIEGINVVANVVK
ncbi:MAG: tyrosine-type recombinase/integrase [Candidatus Avelusimicrobium sp.]|uniref:tyrosine-type recombinase/integrase n=1 Tax=Candidatus Avelusimicrobium sp. TaxID=3048833 RepID=UPI003F0842F0